MKSTIAMIGFWRKFGDRYYDMGKQDILQEDSQNMTIAYDNILKFTFRAENKSTVDDNNNTIVGEIVIKTTADKIKFTHNYYDNNNKIKSILSGLFNKKLKYRGGIIGIVIGGNKDGIN